MNLQKGTIMGFSGSYGSGIGYLKIKKKNGMTVNIPVDNATTVRSLDSAYGNVITAGHTVNQKAIIGKEIEYSMTDYGTMEGFNPIDKAVTKQRKKYI